MMSPDELYASLYKDVVPEDCWDYEFQHTLARMSIEFFLREIITTFGEDTDFSVEMVKPYAFTSLNTFQEAYALISLLGIDLDAWCLAPTGDGGICADYIGVNNICSVLYTKEHNAFLEQLIEPSLELVTTVYSFEVPTDWKAKDMKKLLEKSNRKIDE